MKNNNHQLVIVIYVRITRKTRIDVVMERKSVRQTIQLIFYIIHIYIYLDDFNIHTYIYQTPPPLFFGVLTLYIVCEKKFKNNR